MGKFMKSPVSHRSMWAAAFPGFSDHIFPIAAILSAYGLRVDPKERGNQPEESTRQCKEWGCYAVCYTRGCAPRPHLSHCIRLGTQHTATDLWVCSRSPPHRAAVCLLLPLKTSLSYGILTNVCARSRWQHLPPSSCPVSTWCWIIIMINES